MDPVRGSVSFDEFDKLAFAVADGNVYLTNVAGRDSIPVRFVDGEGSVATLTHKWTTKPKLTPVSLELVQRVALAVGTVVKVQQSTPPKGMLPDPTLYLTVDFGPIGERFVPLVQTDTTMQLQGKQVVCLVNLKRECVHDLPTMPFTIWETPGKFQLPYEVVGKVANGTVFKV